MPALTTTIEPDEFLGLCAITDLEKMVNGGEADVTGIAKTLMHGAVSAKLEELGLPWAPSEEDVRRRAAEVARSAADQSTAARAPGRSAAAAAKPSGQHALTAAE